MDVLNKITHRGLNMPEAGEDLQIRQLLDLSPDHNLVAEADCVFRGDKEKLRPIIGRLYVFDKCVGFYSPKIRPSLVIKYSDVASISKGKGL